MIADHALSRDYVESHVNRFQICTNFLSRPKCRRGSTSGKDPCDIEHSRKFWAIGRGENVFMLFGRNLTLTSNKTKVYRDSVRPILDMGPAPVTPTCRFLVT